MVAFEIVERDEAGRVTKTYVGGGEERVDVIVRCGFTTCFVGWFDVGSSGWHAIDFWMFCLIGTIWYGWGRMLMDLCRRPRKQRAMRSKCSMYSCPRVILKALRTTIYSTKSGASDLTMKYRLIWVVFRYQIYVCHTCAISCDSMLTIEYRTHCRPSLPQSLVCSLHERSSRVRKIYPRPPTTPDSINITPRSACGCGLRGIPDFTYCTPLSMQMHTLHLHDLNKLSTLLLPVSTSDASFQ